MTTKTIELELHGFGAPPGTARADVAELTTAERLKRAAVVFGAFVAVAIIALPIPIVHFVLVPGGLLLAVVLGAAAAAGRRDLPGGAGPLSVLRHGAAVLAVRPVPAAAPGELRELPAAADAGGTPVEALHPSRRRARCGPPGTTRAVASDAGSARAAPTS